MNAISFLIYCLATWRLASLLVDERGPGGVFQRLREKAGIVHDGDGRKAVIPETFAAELLSCVWCSSVWIGLFWAGFDLLLPAAALRLALLLALSAAAIGYGELLRRG